MSRTVTGVLGFVAVASLTLASPAVGATEPPPSAPTNVTVAWEAITPLPCCSTARAVRVSWQESEAQPDRVCQDSGPASYCVETTADEPNTVVMQADKFSQSASTRVSVQALGAPASEVAYSAVFDTQRLAAPTFTNIAPWVDGRLLLTWKPGPAPVDTTPNDPLDLSKPSYRQVSFNGDFFMYGPLLTATSLVISAPQGGLVSVVADEWGFTAPTFEDLINVWDTQPHAKIPTTSTYGQSTVVSGAVTSDPWICYGSPPYCAPGSDPPAARSTPSPGRRVVLQGRNTTTSAWYTVTSTLSGTGGTYRFSVHSPGTRQYRVLVTGVSKPPSSDAKAAGVSAVVRTVAVNRVVSARFDDPYVKVGQRVTARLTMAVPSRVRTTLQRWNGSTWVNVKYVYLTRGTGSYTFTATRRGVVGWRFVIPATTAPSGLPVAGTSSKPFYDKAT
jgi:hypothetical protein